MQPWTLKELANRIDNAIDTKLITGKELFAFYTDSDYTWRAPLKMYGHPVPWRSYTSKGKEFFQEFDDTTDTVAFNTHTRCLWQQDLDALRCERYEDEQLILEDNEYLTQSFIINEMTWN